MQRREYQAEPLRTRFVTEEDLAVCVAMEPTHFGCSSASQQEAYTRFLSALLRRGRALAVVVVDPDNHPLAFGLSLFISDSFRDFLLGNHPRGWIGQALYQFNPSQSVLTPKAIVRAHHEEGLNLLGFYGWRRDLSPPLLVEVHRHLYLSFAYLHQGYHLRSFLKEVYGVQEKEFYLQSGLRCYKQPSEYPFECRRVEPYLMGIERSEVTFPIRVADIFRASAPPSLGRNSYPQSSLLLLAQLAYLLRLSNAELASCLDLKESTVENYWSRLGRRLSTLLSGTSKYLGRRECLMLFERAPELIYPLRIHTLFFHRPELAHRYPLLVETSPQRTVMVPLNVSRVPLRSG